MNPTNTAKSEEKKVRTRFKRVPYGSLYIRDHHVEILQLVHRYRLLSTDLFSALTGAHGVTVNDRLRPLFHNAFLSKPPEQMHSWVSGSLPMVYALGGKGAKLLLERGEIPLKKIDWYGRDKQLKKEFIEHRLGISAFRASLELAIKKH